VTSTNDEAKPDEEKGPEEVAAEKSKSQERRQRPRQKLGPFRSSRQTGQSCFSEFRMEEDIEDHRAKDCTDTLLVPSRTHA
jgi:hypothetical protein